MTDKEIIKALECCTGDEWDICDKCPYQKYKTGRGCTYHILRDTFDLINRQQAEIERLQIRLRKERHQFEDLGKMYSEIRAEAIKEFAERLKKHLKGYGGLYCVTTMNTHIDNLVKEMVGEDK